MKADVTTVPLFFKTRYALVKSIKVVTVKQLSYKKCFGSQNSRPDTTA